MNWGGWAMIFKTSLFNKSLIKSDLKRFWWVSALYALVLFFNLPFYHLMLAGSEIDRWQKEMLSRSLEVVTGHNELQVLLIIVVPVLMAALLFKYLHTPRAAAMMHSLPCTRGTLFFSHNVAGLFLLVVPVVFTALVLMIVQSATCIKEFYSIADIFHWIGYTLLFDLLFYAVAVFVGMFTGNSIAQIVFTYILHFLPEGFNVLLNYNLQELLFGYAERGYEGVLVKYLPIFTLLSGNMHSEYFTAWQIIAYLLVTVAFLGVALYVYKLRKLEAAGDIVAFSMIRPVFKYGVTICTMLLGGAYFAGLPNSSYSVIVLGYLLSIFLGYWVAEMLMQKSFRVWSAYKGYLIYTALVILMLIGIKADIFGYVQRVPDAAQVNKVYLGYNLGSLMELEKGVAKSEDEYWRYAENHVFETGANIKNMISLHKEIVEDPQKKEGPRRYIMYSLKNGRYLVRQYTIDEKEYVSFLKPIYESMEYKETRFPVLTKKVETIKTIEIKDERTPKRPLVISSAAEIKEFTDLLKEELSNATFEQISEQRYYHTRITVIDVKENEMKRAEVSYNLQEDNFPKIVKWLKDKGYYENIMLLPHEVEYVVLEKARIQFSPKDPTGEPVPVRVEIKDPQMIKELLSICSSIEYRRGEEPILVGFYVRGSSGTYQFQENIYQDTPVSEELKTYLKKLDQK